MRDSDNPVYEIDGNLPPIPPPGPEPEPHVIDNAFCRPRKRGPGTRTKLSIGRSFRDSWRTGWWK